MAFPMVDKTNLALSDILELNEFPTGGTHDKRYLRRKIWEVFDNVGERYPGKQTEDSKQYRDDLLRRHVLRDSIMSPYFKQHLYERNMSTLISLFTVYKGRKAALIKKKMRYNPQPTANVPDKTHSPGDNDKNGDSSDDDQPLILGYNKAPGAASNSSTTATSYTAAKPRSNTEFPSKDEVEIIARNLDPDLTASAASLAHKTILRERVSLLSNDGLKNLLDDLKKIPRLGMADKQTVMWIGVSVPSEDAALIPHFKSEATILEDRGDALALFKPGKSNSVYLWHVHEKRACDAFATVMKYLEERA